MSKKTVYPGVYFNGKSYSYRPRVNGRPTERRLKARTEAEAIKEFILLGKNKNAQKEGPIADLTQFYLDSGAPDVRNASRGPEFIAVERARIEKLIGFWGKLRANEIRNSDAQCAAYCAWRKKRMRKGCSGERSVDMELTTLSNVLHYAKLMEKIEANPIATRKKFDTGRSHCRDHCPRSGDELHTIANKLAKHWASQVLTWQMMFEACSGCRTGEALPLRWDAQPCNPGHIRDGKYLCVYRLKQTEDNDPYEYITINPALRLVLEAMKNWNDETRKSVWFFPSAHTDGPVHRTALCNALRRVAKKLLPGRRITSHGMRAFYVTWQRTSGKPITQIAEDVGHVSGVGLILKTYGRKPPPWATTDCTPFPKTVTPVWASWVEAEAEKDQKIIRLSAVGE